MNLLFLDTETTGLTDKDRLIELCIGFPDNSISTWRFKNVVPIDVKAMSVHGITPEMLEDKSYFLNSEIYLYLQTWLPKSIVIGHNVDFDLEMLYKEGLPKPYAFIDTLQVSRHIFPGLDSYSLQFLRYELKLYKDETQKLLPHSAESDVIVLKLLFDRLKKEIKDDVNSLSWMLRFTEQPALISKMPFGKYKGLSFEWLANHQPGYLRWFRSNVVMDKNLVYTMKQMKI